MKQKMSKKHILMVTSTLPRGPADPEPRFVLDLAKAVQKQFRVTVMAPAAPGAKLEEEIEGVRVLRYRYAPLRRWEVLAYPGAIMPRLRQSIAYWPLVPLLVLGLHRALRRLLKQESVDCIHAHWFVPQGLVIALGFLGRHSPPFVVTSHGGDITSLSGRLFDKVFRLIATRAAAVTAVSRPLSRNLGRLLPGEQIAKVIPMGVDSETFHPKQSRHGFYAQFTDPEPIVLFVGRLAEKKGVNHLLRALAIAPLESCAGKLVIVGDGPKKPEWLALTQELGLEKRVTFLPPATHRDLPALFASADILCVPSIVAHDGDTDGMPTVILEGTACGLPCVSTAVGGISDYIRDGENGRLVASGDEQALSQALADLLSDPQARQRMGKKARVSALEYDWQRIGAAFGEIYEQVINERS